MLSLSFYYHHYQKIKTMSLNVTQKNPCFCCVSLLFNLIMIIIQNGLSVFMRLIDLQFSWKHFAIILFQCTIILLSNSTYDSSNIFEINNKFILPSFIVISIAYFLALNYFLILEFFKKIVMKIVHLWQMRKSLVHSFRTGDEVAENLVIKVPL